MRHLRWAGAVAGWPVGGVGYWWDWLVVKICAGSAGACGGLVLGLCWRLALRSGVGWLLWAGCGSGARHGWEASTDMAQHGCRRVGGFLCAYCAGLQEERTRFIRGL